MKNITITIKGKTVRMAEENKLMLSQIISNNPFCVISAEKDGKKFRLELIAGQGARWIEVK